MGSLSTAIHSRISLDLKLIIYSILADEEVRQGLKAWVRRSQCNVVTDTNHETV